MGSETSVVAEVYCFQDQARVCGPDCVAFTVEPLDRTGVVAVPDRCELIRGVRHLRQLPLLVLRIEALAAKVK